MTYDKSILMYDHHFNPNTNKWEVRDLQTNLVVLEVSKEWQAISFIREKVSMMQVYRASLTKTK